MADALDRTFEVSLVLKGLDGVAECVGGLLLLFVRPATIASITRSLTQHELSEDPSDWFAHRILDIGHALEGSGVAFAAAYLLAHGVVKVALVAAVLANRLWAYPTLIIFLAVFVVYQVYRLAIKPSFWLAALTLFDIFIIWLTWREWRRRLAAQAT